jgi:hypothetical protein
MLKQTGLLQAFQCVLVSSPSCVPGSLQKKRPWGKLETPPVENCWDRRSRQEGHLWKDDAYPVATVSSERLALPYLLERSSRQAFEERGARTLARVVENPSGSLSALATIAQRRRSSMLAGLSMGTHEGPIRRRVSSHGASRRWDSNP